MACFSDNQCKAKNLELFTFIGPRSISAYLAKFLFTGRYALASSALGRCRQSYYICTWTTCRSRQWRERWHWLNIHNSLLVMKLNLNRIHTLAPGSAALYCQKTGSGGKAAICPAVPGVNRNPHPFISTSTNGSVFSILSRGGLEVLNSKEWV